MPTLLKTKSIYYNDVNMIAQPGIIKSRSEIPKELNRIIVSPMSAIVGEVFLKKAVDLGLMVCLHRFCTPEQEVNLYHSVNQKEQIFFNVGLNDNERIQYAKKHCFPRPQNVVIDISNGYLPQIKESINRIMGELPIKNLMIGNVHSAVGINNLYDYFRKYYTFNSTLWIRVGIAAGSCCQTSDLSSYGRGQVTELMECYEAKKIIKEMYGREVIIVADGGIKKPSYAAVAFGCGADALLMGGYFAKSNEAETHIFGDGSYWGGASYKQAELYPNVKRQHSEGKVLVINKSELKPLEILVNELWGGLSSAVSYSGKDNLSNFIGNGVFELKVNSLPPKSR